MITEPQGTTVLSSIGWVDGDTLWHLDVRRGRPSSLRLESGAAWLSLHAGEGTRFAVAHHGDPVRFAVTVRDFAAPREVLARAVIDAEGGRLSGDRSAWRGVPPFHVASLRFPPWEDVVLIRVMPDEDRVSAQRLAWFDSSYDKDYQGVLGALELPGEPLVLVAVQRSSRLILHDLATGTEAGHIDLGGHAGGPRIAWRDGEIWAGDYDTLVVVRQRDRRILRHRRMQGAQRGTQQFIGGFAFAPDEPLCVVARPFSGDVVGVDTETLRTRCSVTLGSQPLEVVALPGRAVVARDWKTGSLLTGQLERRGLFG